MHCSTALVVNQVTRRSGSVHGLSVLFPWPLPILMTIPPCLNYLATLQEVLKTGSIKFSPLFFKIALIILGLLLFSYV